MLREKIGKQVLFFDGAMGTSLQKVGLAIGEVPELFNFTHPERVQEVHKGYLEAGSNFITTNTFGANQYKIKETSYTVDEVIKQAVYIAKQAKQDYENTYIVLDIGSTGKLIEPMGEVPFEEIYEVFKEQAIAGEKYGCDVILLETFIDLTEFEAAILAAKENTALPVFCTMSFEANMRTFFGVTLEDMVTLAQNLGVDAVGINCSLGPKELKPVVEKLMKIVSIPVLVQPNAGLPTIENGKAVYNITPEEFADYTAEFAHLGVSLLGGCCGTTPIYIQKMIEKIKNK
ncbi:MAG: homocysteine S-methyltransferase family protein [Cellulosilyticaceae bacterium]